MTRPNRPRYAARLNAFKRKGDTILAMIGRAAEVGGLDAADLNYPDHFAEHDAREVGTRLADAGMAVNGLAMRYYTDPGFRLGAFTHPDPTVRRAAIDQTKAGIDTALGLEAPLMTLWMGQDGFDYAFQLDYARAWDDTIAALEEVCAHAAECDIALEYKPNEPRAFALMPDIGTTLLACRDVGQANLGVTLDFAHVLYADEMPAHSAYLVARHARLLGLHLNDGYAKRDDGLMAGSVHPVQTLELLVEVARQGYDGVIYFDTFPDMGGLDPVAEARASIALTERLRSIAADLQDDAELAAAIALQDAAASTRIVTATLYGA